MAINQPSDLGILDIFFDSQNQFLKQIDTGTTLVMLNDDPVGYWDDQGAEDADATQAIGSLKPSFQNGFVRFAEDQLKLFQGFTDASLAGKIGFTIFASVHNVTSTGQANQTLFSGQNADDEYCLFLGITDVGGAARFKFGARVSTAVAYNEFTIPVDLKPNQKNTIVITYAYLLGAINYSVNDADFVSIIPGWPTGLSYIFSSYTSGDFDAIGMSDGTFANTSGFAGDLQYLGLFSNAIFDPTKLDSLRDWLQRDNESKHFQAMLDIQQQIVAANLVGIGSNVFIIHEATSNVPNELPMPAIILTPQNVEPLEGVLQMNDFEYGIGCHIIDKTKSDDNSMMVSDPQRLVWVETIRKMFHYGSSLLSGFILSKHQDGVAYSVDVTDGLFVSEKTINYLFREKPLG